MANEAFSEADRDDAAEPPPTECCVMGPSGPLCTIELDAGLQLKHVRGQIEEKTGIDARIQRLFQGMRELYSSDDLADFVAAATEGKASELLLVQRPKQQVRWLTQLKELPWNDEGDASQWLATAPPAARADREVVLAAVDQTGIALEAATPELRADREVVWKAVKRSGMALQFAAPALRADRLVVLRAVARTGVALQFAAPELLADIEVVTVAVASDANALQHAAPEMRGNAQVLFTAVCTNGSALQYASPDLRADRRIVRQAVCRDGQALQFAAEELKGDFEIVLSAAIKDGQSVQHAPARYRWNPVFLTRVTLNRRAARARGAAV